MLHFRLLTALSIGLLCSFISFGLQAETTTVIEKRVIVTPAPKGACTSIAGHWEGSVWIDTHDVCTYENRTEGSTWINEYWSCTASNEDGTCTAWTLVPGHWLTK